MTRLQAALVDQLQTRITELQRICGQCSVQWGRELATGVSLVGPREWPSGHSRVSWVLLQELIS